MFFKCQLKEYSTEVANNKKVPDDCRDVVKMVDCGSVDLQELVFTDGKNQKKMQGFYFIVFPMLQMGTLLDLLVAANKK